MRKVKRKDIQVKKKGFPIGIFLFLFVIESFIAIGANAVYFYNTTRTRIENIESDVRNRSITLGEAFAFMAEVSYKTKRYKDLKVLFREKIEEKIIGEAFFVLADGTLVAHSNVEKEKELLGNIANDEFAYNLDMILWPLRKNSKEIRFTDYNIIGKEVPFPRQERMLIKEHIYNRIDSLGWLVSKSVFYKKKPIGTVNFIISKDKIYNYLEEQIAESKRLIIISLGAAFGLSFLVSIIIFIRYRSIQRDTLKIASIPALTQNSGRKKGKRQGIMEPDEIDILGDDESTHEDELPDFIGDEVRDSNESEEEYITIEVLADMDDDRYLREEETFEEPLHHKKRNDMYIQNVHKEDSGPDLNREIKDAIPVKK